jgi:membrane fusion protein, copper/silver efflux system
MSTPRTAKWIAAAGLLVALIIGVAIGRWAGPSQDHAHGDSPAIAEGASAAEVTWTCSMHPQIRQPNFGQCPICGMDLIPLAQDDDADDDSELPRLSVSRRSAALMNIQTAPVERRVIEREIRLLGRIDYDETRVRTVSAWVAGRVDRLLLDVVGARVERGTPLLELFSPQLISAQEEFLQAMRSAAARGSAADDPLLASARERLRLLGLGPEQIDELEQRGTVEDRLTIHAPTDGFIIERTAVEGMYVEPGEQLARLADLSQVCLDLEAYERDLPWLALGQTVRFTVRALPGREFEGQIAQINPSVDPQQRSTLVRIWVRNPDARLMPGMFGHGVVSAVLGGPGGISPGPGDDAGELPLIIPATAALVTGKQAVVYVQVPDRDRPTFELRQVNLGPRAGEYYVVRDGVAEGELVVTHGNFKIDAELQLRGRPSMMAPPDPTRTPAPRTDPRTSPVPLAAPEAIPEEFGREIGQLAQHYIELSEALASDDRPSAQAAAAEMLQQLHRMDTSALPENHLDSWNLLSSRMQDAMHEMIFAADISGVRDHLQPLTLAIEQAIASFHADQLEPLHRAYCPMAFGHDGGTWLQTHQEIRNPYHGASMLRCGETIGRLP